MKLLTEALSSAAPPAAGHVPDASPIAVAAAPAWPLLDALAPPPKAAEAREPYNGTMVQLFGGLSPAPVAEPPPTSLPLAAFAPPAASSPVTWSGPAAPLQGLFPASWVPRAAPVDPAGPSKLVPAERVTTPLADLLHSLGRSEAPTNPVFAGLRLPGSRIR